jgi:hypothetical protein
VPNGVEYRLSAAVALPMTNKIAIAQATVRSAASAA